MTKVTVQDVVTVVEVVADEPPVMVVVTVVVDVIVVTLPEDPVDVVVVGLLPDPWMAATKPATWSDKLNVRGANCELRWVDVVPK